MAFHPMNMPNTYPPAIIRGTWIISTISANMPVLRIFFRLSSMPMQNISMTSPRSANILTMSSVSEFSPTQ